LIHLSNGNSSSSFDDFNDENWSPNQRKRSNKKVKKKRSAINQRPKKILKRKLDVTTSPCAENPPRKKLRVHVSNLTKIRVIDELLAIRAIVKSRSVQRYFKQSTSISYSLACKWAKNQVEIRTSAENPRIARLTVSAECVAVRSEAWFPAAEKAVFTLFEEARANGEKLSCLWFEVTMKDQLAILFGSSADDFKAGDGWRAGFFKRFGLCMRVATNIMPLSVEERVPKCLEFYKLIQKVCAGEEKDQNYGRFPPEQRWNADEVGVEFGCCLRRTAEFKGAKRCWVAQPKHKIELRECTFLPLFNSGSANTKVSMILRAKPKKIDGTVDPLQALHSPTRILISELRLEYPNVEIFVQEKGYMDKETFLCWFKKVFLPTAGQKPQLLVLDNFGAHSTSEIREFAKSKNVTLLFSPPNCTDIIQVTDLGLGYLLKHKMKNKFADNFRIKSERTKWIQGKMTPQDRKRKYVKWLSESVQEFYAKDGQTIVRKIFGRCGLDSKLDESGPQLRKISGYDTPIVVNWRE